MLQDIRQQIQGTTAKIVVGLIVVSFAFFGIESILVSGGGNEIAEVNGEPIFPQDLQQALDTQKRRLIAMMGENIDPAMLDDERLSPQALDSLINRKLLMQSAESLDLAVSESEIGSVVGSMQQFQVDGVFSPELYKSVLASAGYTPSYFKENLRDDMLLNQLRSGISGSDFITPSELELSTRVISEQRDLRYFTIPRETLTSNAAFTQDQIESYYSSHQDVFRTPESVDIDYLELSLDDFRQPVEESAILEAYELAKQESQFQTQNRVSHILFDSAEGRDAKKRMEDAQAEISAGVSFADVARKFSDDIGSADKGGDLGYSSGQTFPEAMEEAISKLEPGVVSGPVETDAGTHLIVVTERKEGGAPSLEEMREQLVETLQADEARVALLRNVELLRDLSFNADDLSHPAKELGLTVQQTEDVSRLQNEGLFSNSTLLEAAFSEEVLVAGHNSEVIELGADKFVVLRVRQHNQSEIKPLEAVKDQIVASLTEETARAAVVDEAGNILEQMREGLGVEQLAAAKGYDVQVELGVNRRNGTLPQEVLQRVFELPPPTEGKTTAEFVMVPNGDAVVVELLRVNAGDYEMLPETDQQQLQQLLSGEFGNLTSFEFQRGLREQAEITVL